MADHAGFLTDIIAHPDDDTPRLIYADWLDEQDKTARAEFIRVQCELARLIGPLGAVSIGNAGRVKDLRQRRAALLYQLASAISAPFKQGDWHGITHHTGEPVITIHLKGQDDAWVDVRLTFRRGFACAVACPCDAWLERGPRLVREQPLRLVELIDKEPGGLAGGTEDRSGFFWEPGIRYDSPHQIPFALPEAVGWKPFFFGGIMVYRFPTAELATDALSAACLLWAKEQSC